MDSQLYDHEDFVRNPGKYMQFRTARIVEAVASVPELHVGRIVRVRYFTTQTNHPRGGVAMPIYQVWIDGDKDMEKTPHLLYACALKGFVL